MSDELNLPIHHCPICKQVYRCSFPTICERGDCSICLHCMISDDAAIQGLITGFNAEWEASHGNGNHDPAADPGAPALGEGA